MTSMKKIRTEIFSKHSINVYSNMLHLRVKIRFYFSVSNKPLGEILKKKKKNLLCHLYMSRTIHTYGWLG
jgi:hypothetical protein